MAPLCVELGKSPPRALRHDEVLLALVVVERLFEC